MQSTLLAKAGHKLVTLACLSIIWPLISFRGRNQQITFRPKSYIVFTFYECCIWLSGVLRQSDWKITKNILYMITHSIKAQTRLYGTDWTHHPSWIKISLATLYVNSGIQIIRYLEMKFWNFNPFHTFWFDSAKNKKAVLFLLYIDQLLIRSLKRPLIITGGHIINRFSL
jgi:hypothetical protein